MSIMDSKGALTKAAKDLLMRWEETKTVWQDAQAADFEKTYLLLIEQDVRAAVNAMDQMNAVLLQIRSDCE